jgi:hypothetical protein
MKPLEVLLAVIGLIDVFIWSEYEQYDKVTGGIHKSRSSVYYFLHSHAWRKVVPRRQPPQKASDEAIEASKKLTPS